MTDTHPTVPVPNEPERPAPTAPANAASPSSPTMSTAAIPLPPQNPWAPPAPPVAPGHADSARRPGIGLVLATSLLAGALGAGLGAGVVIAADDDATTSPATTAGEVGGVSTTVLPNGSVARVADTVLPSVVSIQVSSAQGGGSGSGIVIDEAGLILTNNHVIEGAADGGSLSVAFQDGTSTSAEIVGRDPSADIAVIRVDADNLQAVKLGSSDDLQVGETVVAIGSPLGLSGTVTTGIVSAKNRPVLPGSTAGDESVLNAIQTDAAINPGNSGGALVNLKGELVGVNSAIATLGSSTGGQSGSIGLGFAIPIDQAKWISDQLIESGTAQHARLGVSVESATGEVRGATIMTVEPGSTAEEIGLETGDVITGFDAQTIDSADSLVAAVRSAEPGTTVTITVVRGGNTETVEAPLVADTTTS